MTNLPSLFIHEDQTENEKELSNEYIELELHQVNNSSANIEPPSADLLLYNTALHDVQTNGL